MTTPTTPEPSLGTSREKDWSEMTAAERIADLFREYDLRIVVASDTFDPLVDRIRALLSHGRRMVIVDRYANNEGADDLTITTGLRLDDEPDRHGPVEPIQVNASSFQNTSFRSLYVRLAPGIRGFGFSTDGRDHAAMRKVYDARGQHYYAPVTMVRVVGRGAEPGRNDLIEIEHWNEHRVCILTTVAFQADWG